MIEVIKTTMETKCNNCGSKLKYEQEDIQSESELICIDPSSLDFVESSREYIVCPKCCSKVITHSFKI